MFHLSLLIILYKRMHHSLTCCCLWVTSVPGQTSRGSQDRRWWQTQTPKKTTSAHTKQAACPVLTCVCWQNQCLLFNRTRRLVHWESGCCVHSQKKVSLAQCTTKQSEWVQWGLFVCCATVPSLCITASPQTGRLCSQLFIVKLISNNNNDSVQP